MEEKDKKCPGPAGTDPGLEYIKGGKRAEMETLYAVMEGIRTSSIQFLIAFGSITILAEGIVNGIIHLIKYICNIN